MPVLAAQEPRGLEPRLEALRVHLRADAFENGIPEVFEAVFHVRYERKRALESPILISWKLSETPQETIMNFFELQRLPTNVDNRATTIFVIESAGFKYRLRSVIHIQKERSAKM
jgi:hypothetical protein